MIVAISINGNKNNKVYHRPGCLYAKRIKGFNRVDLDENIAIRRHFHECKYCAGLRGDVRTRKSTIIKWEKRHQMKFDYDKYTDTLYIATKIGFWKIFQKEYSGKYYLYHRNQYEEGMNFETAKHGEFHRQADVKSTSSLDRLVDYIAAHDKAKEIIKEDYRKLPRATKKQKKYYEAAARKKNNQDKRRVYELFAVLESNDSRLKTFSIY